MKTAHIYIATDSTTPKVSEKHYGYVLECEISGEARTREGFGMVTGTYNQATLTALEKALDRFRQGCELHIHTENTFVLGMLCRNLKTWAGNGFLTSRGKEVANREEWEKVWNLSRKHLVVAEPGGHPYSGWIRGEIRRRKEKENV